MMQIDTDARLKKENLNLTDSPNIYPNRDPF